MSMEYKAIAEKVLAVLKTAGVDAVVGLIPTNGGVAVAFMGGQPKRDFAGNTRMELRITLNAKAAKQTDAVALLDKAHSVFNALSGYVGDKYRILGTKVIDLPTTAGRPDNMWIMTSRCAVIAFIEVS